jgi:Phosphate uptake regulator
VLAILHTNLHPERRADYCVTIAKLTKLVADVKGDATMQQTLQEMGERAEEMIRVALDAFANRDLAAAESLVELDELIDRSNRRFVDRVVEIVGEPGLREWVLRMVLVSRRWSGSATRGGHRRADLLPADGRVPRVHGRLAPRAARLSRHQFVTSPA